MLGLLLPMHRRPQLSSGYTSKCGEVWEEYGIHRIEQFFRAIDDINNSDDLLPGINLGYDIRDTCWLSPVALEQSIDFIRNKISSLEEGRSPLKNKTSDRKADQCQVKESVHQKPIAALIGPGSSAVSIQIQNVVQLFQIPQIGYSATSLPLSDKKKYKYFLRVVPSDEQQAQALVDIVAKYNWTYISTAYTAGSYGESGMEVFTKNLRKKAPQTCIASANHVKLLPTQDMTNELYDEAVQKLDRAGARVVICFCEGDSVRGLFQATKRQRKGNHFLIIGSDGWNNRADVVRGIEQYAKGGMSIRLHSPTIPDFDDYFFKLHPNNNSRNPWFKEYWETNYKCRLSVGSSLPHDSKILNMCNKFDRRNETGFAQDSKLALLINGLYAVAHALHRMKLDVCGNSTDKLCEAMKPVNGTELLKYLFKTQFLSPYSKSLIKFDEKGDGPGRYDIMNFQRFEDSTTGKVTYGYVQVGNWDSGELKMNDSQVYWPRRGRSLEPIDSICSPSCPRGQIKKITKRYAGIACCWDCAPCQDDDILIDELSCKKCAKGWWPSQDLTVCLLIKVEHIRWGDTEAIVAMTFASVGLLFTAWIFWTYITNNNTAVVKASTRELSYIILLGVAIAYSTTFPLVARPSLVSCYFTRIMPGLSFALVYGALATKTNRIARILAGSKKKIMTRKPRFLSTSAQVVITSLIIGIECAVITGMMIFEPANSTLRYPTKQRVMLVCNTSDIGLFVPLGFDFFLISLCTLYAIRTRKLPENFNEAKFIGFSMYTTCIIWLGFIPIYYGSESQILTMSLSMSMTASVALMFLFGPKVYIIIWKPEKNNRSAFTTAGKDIRCYVGGNQEDKSMHNAALAMMRQKKAVSKWKSLKNTRPSAARLHLRNAISEKGADDTTPAAGGSSTVLRKRTPKFEKSSQTDSYLIDSYLSSRSELSTKLASSSTLGSNQNTVVAQSNQSTPLRDYHHGDSRNILSSQGSDNNVSEVLINIIESPSVSRFSSTSTNTTPKLRVNDGMQPSAPFKIPGSPPDLTPDPAPRQTHSHYDLNSPEGKMPPADVDLFMPDAKRKSRSLHSMPKKRSKPVANRRPEPKQSLLAAAKSSSWKRRKKSKEFFSANSLSSGDTNAETPLSSEDVEKDRSETDDEDMESLQKLLQSKGIHLDFNEIKAVDV